MYMKDAALLLVVFLAVASTGPPGSPVVASMDDRDACDALQFAVAQHNKATNDPYVIIVLKVISVQKQVVAGIKYIFTVVLARTSCKKGGGEEVCPIHPNPAVAQVQQCILGVWVQPWLSTIQVVDNTCK